MNASANGCHVVFGTGPLGLAVMRELVQRGERVRMVNRSGKAQVPDKVQIMAGDAYDPKFTREAAKGAAAVYQCAQPRYTEWAEKFPPLQASILEGAAANNAKLIVGENLYMYGDTDGQPLTEDLPYNAHTKKGQVRARMAQAALDAHKQGKVRVAVARASDFYGPEVLGSALGARVFYPMLRGKAAQVAGDIDLPHTYSVIDDFGKAMVILGERDEALGQAWHIPNPPTLTTRELLNLAFKLAGLPPRISVVSRFVMHIGGVFIPEAREMVEMMYEFEKPFIVDHSKFVKAFGDHATPHEEALRRALEWYRTHSQSAGH